jgi:hypothetical protein
VYYSRAAGNMGGEMIVVVKCRREEAGCLRGVALFIFLFTCYKTPKIFSVFFAYEDTLGLDTHTGTHTHPHTHIYTHIRTHTHCLKVICVL